MTALWYFTLKDLLQDRWRSLLTVLSLAVLVVGFLLLGAQAQSYILYSGQTMPTNNIMIIAADTTDPMDSSLDESVLQAARRIAPGELQAAFPSLFRHLNIDGRVMQVRAAPLEEMQTHLSLRLVQGRWPSAPQEVVVSDGAALLGSWKPGSIVNIYGTDFTVSGVLRTDENMFGALWMTYPDGLKLFGTQRGFQIGYLSLDPGVQAEGVRQRLLADPAFAACCVAYRESAYIDENNHAQDNLLILTIMLTLVALLAFTFSVYNATSLSLAERSREIGLLRLLGFTRGRVRVFLLARTLLLVLLAYGLGGTAAALLITRLRIHSTYQMVFEVLRMDALTTWAGLVLALVFAILGVWFTSGRLAALDPLGREGAA
jgi:ABC-type antimicrobial peptide transport system permease subunit